MLFIQRKWTNERKSGYESLKQWCLLLQRKNSDQARIWKICVLHLPLTFMKDGDLTMKLLTKQRRFENEFAKRSRSPESL